MHLTLHRVPNPCLLMLLNPSCIKAVCVHGPISLATTAQSNISTRESMLSSNPHTSPYLPDSQVSQLVLHLASPIQARLKLLHERHQVFCTATEAVNAHCAGAC